MKPVMRRIPQIAALALAAALQACAAAPAGAPRSAAAVAEARAPVTILVSIDGFRPDYLDRGVTPALSRLAAGGVRAAMRPSFPSKTFPNHWAIVTGKVPDRNGIVANAMQDPARPGETFTMATEDPFWWNATPPIWVDADKAGIRTATMFWPGASVAWGGTAERGGRVIVGGTRPDDWQQFAQAVTGPQRVNAVIDWLRRPAAIRPKLVTLYFDTVDTAGHQFGPDAAETTAAVADVDASIAMLVNGLAELGQPANLVIVSDHGMAATAAARTIRIDRIADPADYVLFEAGPYAALHAVPGHEAALEKALLAPHDHMTCWRKAEIPARLRYGANPRIPPYLCLADVEWSISDRAPRPDQRGGNHGWDNRAPQMAALFVANGPAFAPGRTLPAFDNVDVHALLRDLIGLPPAPDSDGSDAVFKPILTPR